MAAAAPFIQLAAGQLSAERTACRAAASLRASARASAGVRGLTHPANAEGLDGDESSAPSRVADITGATGPCVSYARSLPAHAILRRWRACAIRVATPAPRRSRRRSPEATGPSICLRWSRHFVEGTEHPSRSCPWTSVADLAASNSNRSGERSSFPRPQSAVRVALAECGDDLSSWQSAQHFTPWLGLAPSNKVSGGEKLSSRTRRSGGRAAALLRTVGAPTPRSAPFTGDFRRAPARPRL
nr:transposase [Mesorhizobium sp.]